MPITIEELNKQREGRAEQMGFPSMEVYSAYVLNWKELTRGDLPNNFNYSRDGWKLHSMMEVNLN